MRTRNSIKNSIFSFAANFITIIIGLVAQAVFIKILGNEYLGINGLFTNIISMLGIVELGVGYAIIYNLYKPIANNDFELIKSLMLFYKKCYRIISLVVLILGLSLIPFLGFFVGDTSLDINLNLIYILFVIDIACSYILSYKRSIIIAYQKSYIVNIIHIGYLLILNLLQIIILIITKDYYLFLIIKILVRIIENVVITYIAKKMYPYLLENSEKLDKNIKNNIFEKIKALIFHKIGGFIVLGSDNLIISKFLGIVQVGLYSNYYLIISAIQSLFGQIINSLTPSVGNLLVEKSKYKNFIIFKKIRFLNFWISCFSGISLLIIMDSFIKIWIGDKYILPLLVLVVLILNYYQKSMRSSYTVFKDAAGIYYEDRFVPIVESILNIVSSIILLHYFGLAGVFMGTVISGLALWCFSYPKYVYKKLFDRDYINYAKETLSYLFLFIVIASVTYFISININFTNIYIEFLSNILISLIIPNIILLLIFYKNDNFKYYFNLIKNRGKV